MRWLLETDQYAICCKARQIGLSHTSAAMGVLWGAFHGELTTIISLGDRESVEALDKARRHCKVLERFGSKLAVPVRANSEEIQFPSGGRIKALPSTGGRSFSGNVILDEFAYHEAKQPEKVWDSAMATTTLGYRGRVISTPNGLGNKFAEVWRAARDPAFGWTRHEIPIELAKSEGFPVDEKAVQAISAGSADLYAQLYQCRFVDFAHRFLFRDPGSDESIYYDTTPRTMRIAIGLDFAVTAKTSADFSAAVVMGETPDAWVILEVIRAQVEPRQWRDQCAALHARYSNAMMFAFVAATEEGTIEFFRESGLPIACWRAKGKFQQAIPLATQWNQGRVLVPRDAPWVQPFVTELVGFTGEDGRKDDQVDAASSAFAGLSSSHIDLAYYNRLQDALPKPIAWD